MTLTIILSTSTLLFVFLYSRIPRNDGSDEEEEVAENGSVKDEDMGSLAPVLPVKLS